MTDAERIKQLEAENLVMQRALKEIKELGSWYSWTHVGPDLEVHHALKVEVVEMAEKALEKCQNTAQLSREREADLAVVEAAKKCARGYKVAERIDRDDPDGLIQEKWLATPETVKLGDTLADRERVYREGK